MLAQLIRRHQSRCSARRVVDAGYTVYTISWRNRRSGAVSRRPGDEQKTLTLLAALVCEPSRRASTQGCRSLFL
jgi:hypothetical protein